MGMQGELGDMCEVYHGQAGKGGGQGKNEESDSTDLPGYVVQRQWSNASAAAGHNPCVPVPNAPYFNVTPQNLQEITLDAAGKSAFHTSQTRGIAIDSGATGTVNLGFYSDQPMAAWTIRAELGGPFLKYAASATPWATVTLGTTTGANGATTTLTIKVNSVAPATSQSGPTGYGVVTIVSDDPSGMYEHYMPILVHSAK
jgi:hypothetical protein